MANKDPLSTIYLKPNKRVKNWSPKHNSCAPSLFGVLYLLVLQLLLSLHVTSFHLINTFTKPSWLLLCKLTKNPYATISSNSFLTILKTLSLKFNNNNPFLKEGRIIAEIAFYLNPPI
jgi:hypothetical protein